MRLVAAGIIMAVLLGPTAVLADGPTVGASCTATWGAVTKDDTGAALPADMTISYKVYISQNQTAPQLVTATPITGTSYQPCVSLATGQYYLWVSAVGKTAGGSESEGLKSAAFPFVLIRPATPTLTVK